MTLRIKYCGGCNPTYDRTALVNRLREEFPGLEITTADDPPPDVTLEVNGCGRACAAGKAAPGRLATLALNSAADYGAVAGALTTLLSKDPIL